MDNHRGQRWSCQVAPLLEAGGELGVGWFPGSREGAAPPSSLPALTQVRRDPPAHRDLSLRTLKYTQKHLPAWAAQVWTMICSHRAVELLEENRSSTTLQLRGLRTAHPNNVPPPQETPWRCFTAQVFGLVSPQRVTTEFKAKSPNPWTLS